MARLFDGELRGRGRAMGSDEHFELLEVAATRPSQPRCRLWARARWGT